MFPYNLQFLTDITEGVCVRRIQESREKVTRSSTIWYVDNVCVFCAHRRLGNSPSYKYIRLYDH